jgi:hypothetical protein
VHANLSLKISRQKLLSLHMLAEFHPGPRLCGQGRWGERAQFYADCTQEVFTCCGDTRHRSHVTVLERQLLELKNKFPFWYRKWMKDFSILKAVDLHASWTTNEIKAVILCNFYVQDTGNMICFCGTLLWFLVYHIHSPFHPKLVLISAFSGLPKYLLTHSALFRNL